MTRYHETTRSIQQAITPKTPSPHSTQSLIQPYHPPPINNPSNASPTKPDSPPQNSPAENIQTAPQPRTHSSYTAHRDRHSEDSFGADSRTRLLRRDTCIFAIDKLSACIYLYRVTETGKEMGVGCLLRGRDNLRNAKPRPFLLQDQISPRAVHM